MQFGQVTLEHLRFEVFPLRLTEDVVGKPLRIEVDVARDGIAAKKTLTNAVTYSIHKRATRLEG